MADFADEAQIVSERHLAAALQSAKSHNPILKPKGRCYNCEEPVAQGLRFCDDGGDCRDDFEWRKQRERSLVRL